MTNILQDPLAPIKDYKRKNTPVDGEVSTGVVEDLEKSHSEQIFENTLANKEKLFDSDTEMDIAIALKEALKRDMLDSLKKACAEFPDKDFFMEVFYRKHTGLQTDFQMNNPINVGTLCPTPTHNHSVYQYHYKTDTLELLWTIPPYDESVKMLNTYDHLTASKAERDLMQYLWDFMDYSLRNKAKKINGEI